MKKVALVVGLWLLWPAASSAAAGRLTIPAARQAIHRYEHARPHRIDYCRAYSPRWVHCKVDEFGNDGWTLRYSIEVKLRAGRLVLSSLAFGHLATQEPPGP